MTTELKEFNPSVNSFFAAGKKYLVHGSISVGRYRMYEALQAQLAWGVDFDKQLKDLKKAWALLNQTKLAEAAVQINNMMEGIARHVEQREHPALLLCTLFICREGEDLGVWNEAEALEKISDWKAEGYDVGSFFAFASSLVKGFQADLQARLAGTLQGGGETAQS